MTNDQRIEAAKVRLKYSKLGAKIYAIWPNENKTMFADIRAWGHLTGTGALNLPHDVAENIQDDWGQKICDLWNNAADQAPADVQSAINLLDALEKEGSQFFIVHKEKENKYQVTHNQGGLWSEPFNTNEEAKKFINDGKQKANIFNIQSYQNAVRAKDKATIEKLRDALKFYADANNRGLKEMGTFEGGKVYGDALLIDNGKIATQILKETE